MPQHVPTNLHLLPHLRSRSVRFIGARDLESKLLTLVMVIPPLLGNPYNYYIVIVLSVNTEYHRIVEMQINRHTNKMKQTIVLENGERNKQHMSQPRYLVIQPFTLRKFGVDILRDSQSVFPSHSVDQESRSSSLAAAESMNITKYIAVFLPIVTTI